MVLLVREGGSLSTGSSGSQVANNHNALNVVHSHRRVGQTWRRNHLTTNLFTNTHDVWYFWKKVGSRYPILEVCIASVDCSSLLEQLSLVVQCARSCLLTKKLTSLYRYAYSVLIIVKWHNFFYFWNPVVILLYNDHGTCNCHNNKSGKSLTYGNILVLPALSFHLVKALSQLAHQEVKAFLSHLWQTLTDIFSLSNKTKKLTTKTRTQQHTDDGEMGNKMSK